MSKLRSTHLRITRSNRHTRSVPKLLCGDRRSEDLHVTPPQPWPLVNASGPSVGFTMVAGCFNSRRFLDELYRVCSTGRARFTDEHSAIELSILLCISEAHENFVEQTKSGRCRAANRGAVADRRRVAHNRRASGSGGGVYFRSASFLDAPGNSGSCAPLERNRWIMANG
jgi:hypothetical protein